MCLFLVTIWYKNNSVTSNLHLLLQRNYIYDPEMPTLKPTHIVEVVGGSGMGNGLGS